MIGPKLIQNKKLHNKNDSYKYKRFIDKII